LSQNSQSLSRYETMFRDAFLRQRPERNRRFFKH
jgi:hypothetical protein